MNRGTGSAEGASLSRRELVARGALAGAGLAVAGALPGRAAAAPARTRPVRRPAQELVADSGINFSLLFAAGAAGYGASEFGEVVTAVNRVNEHGATYDAVFDEFWRLGELLRSRGERALANGHRVTARDSFLRAATYFEQCLFFVLGTRKPGRERLSYRTMNDCFTRAATLFAPPFERVEIPYEGTTLPGWFLSLDPGGPARPTIIVNNGSDGQNVDLWSWGGAAALERGFNALIFEGPGQGAMLFERGVPFRPDWERVVTPVVDFLAARPDVDAARIAISGWSMAGELVARAAAFEHRLAAVILDPGAVSVIEAWPLPKELIELVNDGKRGEVNRIWAEYSEGMTAEQRFEFEKRSEIFRPPDFYGLVKELERYTDADVAGEITSPTLVTSYEDETFFPGQAERLYRLLRAPKALVRFGAADGTQYHDAPMAPQRRNEVVYDWLEQTLGLSG